MNKFFLVFIVILSFISIFSYYTDIYMPYSDCSYETFPYFFNIYNNENYLSFFYNKNVSNDIVLRKENNIKSIFYDESYDKIYYSNDLHISYLQNNRKMDLYYGLGILNNSYTNNIHSSLFLNNNNYYISGYSNFIKESYNPYSYYNQLFFSYKNIATFTTLNINEKEFLLGYKNNDILILAGYNNSQNIPINIKIKKWGFSLLGNIKYYYNMKTFIYESKIIYYNYINRIHFLPIIEYKNDSINILGGMLYRVYPYMSVFCNYNYSKERFSSGLKFSKYNMFANYQTSYFINTDTWEHKVSLLIREKYSSLVFNTDYKDSLIFNTQLILKTYFYNDNLQPQFYINYDSDNNLKTFLNIKLIDAFLIFGSEWDLDKKTYLLNGGIQWYFYETLY